MILAIPYKCACMANEASAEVEERKPGQDIVDWVQNTVGAAISRNHRQRSPTCTRTTMEYAKIPAPENAPFLGAAPKLDS